MYKGWAWWLTPVILVNQEAEIRRILARGQPKQKVNETPISTNTWSIVFLTCHPSYVGGVDRRTKSRLARTKTQDPI
jgi:hypothetical protein